MSLKFVTTISEYGSHVLRVTYTDCEDLDLDLKDLFKDLSNFDTLYEYINEYLVTLPLASQKAIYDVFYSVYDSDDKNSFDNQLILNKMEGKIAEVVELLNYKALRLWNESNTERLYFPDNIVEVHKYDPDGNTTPEKTYIKSAYRDLIALVVCMRAVAPLYVDFYNRINQVTPHYYYKMFMLFVRSEIAECDEVVKLKQYLDVNRQTLIGSTKNENLILFAGLADDDILDSLLSEVIFNKLLPIDFINKKCNIISFIFNTIRYKGNHAPASGQYIRGKSVENNPNKEDISYFENYRKTSNLPVGTVVEIQHALSDVNYLIRAVGETNFNHKAYNQELAGISQYLNQKLDTTQVYLVGWFMNKVINPRALYYIEYRRLVELMLFAKTILMQHNHIYIAMVMSAKKTNDAGYVGMTIKNSMNKDSVKRLVSHYSFCMEDDKTSIIEKTILEISKEIANTTWIARGTPEQLKKTNLAGIYLETPVNVNDLVLDFVEFVNA